MTERSPAEDDVPEAEFGKLGEVPSRRPRMTSDEIADQAQRVIEEAITRNLAHEIVIVGILVSVAVVGIFLLLSGASTLRWELLASGSACAVAVGWPVSRLFAMWKFNLALKILPAIIRMSEAKSRQSLVLRFVDQLIGLLEKD